MGTSNVEVVHWNPRRKLFKSGLAARLPIYGKRPNNFGDLLGPLLVERLLGNAGIETQVGAPHARLATAGSIMGMVRDGDYVWGSGINGRYLTEQYSFTKATFLAVRGPLTRSALRERGFDVPEVYGDPGLLVRQLIPQPRESNGAKILFVPNLNDNLTAPPEAQVLDPRRPLEECLQAIASARFVIGSSLHAIVVADAYGVPARLVASQSEPRFKYDDYFLGSGRPKQVIAADAAHALNLGPHDELDWDDAPLLSAFPFHLWAGSDKL